ncbi:MAG TPA: cytochrome c oxidase assembly protein, partial [Chloroflexota bacterium]|nr:cytochrome c oxidase assembly protein [Chloroflexota bacterium]
MDSLLLSAWTLDPSILSGLVGLAAVYAVTARADRYPSRGRLAAWALGLACLIFALMSPLDALSDHTLLTAHMIQHLFLLLVIPTLLLFGAPDRLLAVLGSLARLPGCRWVCMPLGSFALATVVLWAWHAPALYEAALRNDLLHAFEHLGYLVTATLYWWPVLRPATYPWPIAEPVQILYLFGGALTSSMVGALITFSSAVLYPTYLHPTMFADWRNGLGISVLGDQALGGLLMWTTGGVWCFVVAMVVFGRWFAREG